MPEDAMPENKLVPRKAILFEDKGSYLVSNAAIEHMAAQEAIDLQIEFAKLVDNNRAYVFDVLDDPEGMRITWEKK